ncbi:Fe2+-dependent dioxygenase [Thiofilum flexile]|uniref:Fe2+-dependent dioxygenase n=1 Tax=Thiofilum flexile TaxID=125627 RepID=UPI0003655637|nr:Fe2+-dependent dioxygenase [Thiofilum flexile]
MLLAIPQVLSPDAVAYCRSQLLSTEWVDGKVTAGLQSAQAKYNSQLSESNPVARALGDFILDALVKCPTFVAAALPLKIFPPLFNCYQDGGHFGTHVDNAIRHIPGTIVRMRTDLSCTLFLTPPEDYEGGELIIEDTYGNQSVKLQTGDMVLYPSTSLHQVMPVTQGARISAFFWLQSMVRDDGERALLYDLDQSIQTLASEVGLNHPNVVRLSGVYHNLMRRWANT